MGTEIERKFLVTSDLWQRQAIRRAAIRQKGLLRDPNGSTGRIRLIAWGLAGAGEPLAQWKAIVTLKGRPTADNLSRSEFEWEIPFEDGEAMFRAWPGPCIEKTRFDVRVSGRSWDVDVFHGENEGLVVAEIEFPSMDAANSLTDLPDWVGADVTSDRRYSNSLLELNPWRNWGRSG
jgi:CYTH domain-containing protein